MPLCAVDYVPAPEKKSGYDKNPNLFSMRIKMQVTVFL